MKLSRTAIKELLKRYRAALLNSLGLFAVIFLGGNASDSFADTAIQGGTETAPVNAAFFYTDGNLLEFNSGFFEMPDMIDNFNNYGSQCFGSDCFVNFSNASVRLTNTNYEGFGGKLTYSFDDNSVLDLTTGDTEDIYFERLSGAGAQLSFEIFIGKNNDELIFTTDTVRSETSYQFDFDANLVSGYGLPNLIGDNGLKEYSVQVLYGNLTFKPIAASTDVFFVTDVYQYKVGLKDEQSVLFSAVKVTDGDSLKAINNYQGDSLFVLREADSNRYIVNDDLGETFFGKKTIQGVTPEEGSDPISIIDASGADNLGLTLFELKKDTSGQSRARTAIEENRTTHLTVTDVIIQGAKSVLKIEEGAGLAEFNNVVLQNSKNASDGYLIENHDTLLLKDFVVDSSDDNVSEGAIKNTGVITAIDSSFASVLNEQELNLSGEVKLKELTGNGTVYLSDATLNTPDEFETANNFVAKGLILGETSRQFKTANLEVIDNTILDIKSVDVTVNELLLGENSTLKVTLNGLSDYGSITGDKLDVKTGGGLQFDFGNNFTEGVYQVFNMAEITALPLVLNLNENYVLTDLQNGSYSFALKKGNATESFLVPESNETRIINALKEGDGTNESFNEMQKELLEALNSKSSKTRNQGLEALDAIGYNFASVVQSVTVEQFNELSGAIQASLNKKSETRGDLGVEETSRASVWSKAFYSKTKERSARGYKINGSGGILGVQTKVTDTLTLGLGYAYSYGDVNQKGRDTTINNNTAFGYLRYQPDNWFIDALLSYTRGQYEEEKSILSSKGMADYNVDSLALQGMIGYNTSYKNLLLTPKIGLRYLKINQESYTDTFGTKVDNVSTNYLTFISGMDMALPYKSVKGFSVRPTASLLFGYDLKTDDTYGVNTLSNGASYFTEGKSLSRFSTNVQLGLETKINERTRLSLEYTGSFRSSYQDHGGMLKVKYDF